MSELVKKLLRSHLEALKPYESARRLFSGGQDWLNANESPFSNDYQIDASRFNRYPSCQPEEVIDAYANYAGVKYSQTLMTRGADEGIELLIRTFCESGKDSVLICPPTYGMYAISAETCNVGVEKAPLNADFSLDVEAVCAYKGKVKLVFICSPNNPTGTVVDAEDIQRVVEHFADSALVVVDEAYIEFSPENAWANKLPTYENLVVLRTLSKAFALAGLRCGFTLANEPVIQALLKVIAPYPVPEPVAQIAEQALSPQGLATTKRQVAQLQEQKALLKNRLSDLPEVELVGDIRGNFLLFRTTQKQPLMDFLVAHGVLIRDQSKQLALDNCLRISVGNAEQNARLMDLITTFLTQQDTQQ